MIRFIFLMFAFVNAFFPLKAQKLDSAISHRIKLNIEVPIQFGIGYEGKIYKKWNGIVQVGFLTEPNSTLVLNIIESLGAEESVVLMIEDAFQSGLILEQGINYNLKRSYFGIFTQQYFLSGSETSKEVVEEAMGEDLSTYPWLNNRLNSNESTLELKSNLFQIGLLYGYRIPLNNHLEIDFEIGVSANISSKSSVSSEVRNYDTLSDKVDIYLRDIYKTYGYVPSLAISLVRNFK